MPCAGPHERGTAVVIAKPGERRLQILQKLAAMLESGPIPAVHGVVRWRIVDLCQWIFEEFRVSVSQQTLSRVLRAMGYRKLSARPRHHAQAAGAIEDFKKVSPLASRRSVARTASIRRP